MTLALTGHRPNKLGGYAAQNPMRDWVKAQLRAKLIELKPRVDAVLSGMALGFDQWGAEVCIELSIPWEACLPFPGQEDRWPAESQAHYRELLRFAKAVHHVMPFYKPNAFQVRNVWMVDHCEEMVSCWDGSEGGTANCLWAAARVNRPVFNIDPRAFRA